MVRETISSTLFGWKCPDCDRINNYADEDELSIGDMVRCCQCKHKYYIDSFSAKHRRPVKVNTEVVNDIRMAKTNLAYTIRQLLVDFEEKYGVSVVSITLDSVASSLNTSVRTVSIKAEI